MYVGVAETSSVFTSFPSFDGSAFEVTYSAVGHRQATWLGISTSVIATGSKLPLSFRDYVKRR